MSCHEWESKLNDRLDGLLDARDVEELEGHIASCSECAGFRADLLELRRQAAALSRDVEPGRDLWPGIRDRLERAAARPRPSATPPSRWMMGLAAAAILVVGFAAGLMLRPAMHVDPSALLASYEDAESEYIRITDDLLLMMENRRSELSPETLAVMDENIRIIDEAIREVRVALEEDPANVGNGRRFTHLYGRKVALLRQAVGMPTES